MSPTHEWILRLAAYVDIVTTRTAYVRVAIRCDNCLSFPAPVLIPASLHQAPRALLRLQGEQGVALPALSFLLRSLLWRYRGWRGRSRRDSCGVMGILRRLQCIRQFDEGDARTIRLCRWCSSLLSGHSIWNGSNQVSSGETGKSRPLQHTQHLSQLRRVDERSG
ncbi:hypothetical protein PFISCL1PPCAC_21761 [Pristionchus fissidentatus]|uniref:Ribosomal protein n=1 Tax=Pristionchus fissidentatus TaxID=1538716 RepID=A0AAV5WIB4_9BILA|nr:hypothetical protein PFISCL1PPCAC_21761 [Pristionchus fissidentatus]